MELEKSEISTLNIQQIKNQHQNEDQVEQNLMIKFDDVIPSSSLNVLN